MNKKNYFTIIKNKIALFKTVSMLKHLSRKNKIIFSPATQIGDTLFSCALIKELEKQDNYNYKLVISKKTKHIVERFNFKNVYYFSPKLKTELICYSSKTKKLIENKINKSILIPYLWYFYSEEEYKKSNYSLDLLTFIKKEVFKLKKSNPTIEYIKIKESKPKIDITKKYVILIPYSLSANIPMEILIKIAKKLKEKGYICYSNVTKSQKEIPGTIRFDFSLDDFAIASKYASAVIGIRTGAMDCVVSYAKKIFAIYDNDNVYHSYTLSQWQTSCNIYEYLYSNNIEVDLFIEKIISDFKESSNI